MNLQEAKDQLIEICKSPETITEEKAFMQEELCKYIYEQSKDSQYQDRKYELKTIEENGEIIIEFEGKYYKDAIEFIMSAMIGDEFFRAALFKTDNWEVIR